MPKEERQRQVFNEYRLYGEGDEEPSINGPRPFGFYIRATSTCSVFQVRKAQMIRPDDKKG